MSYQVIFKKSISVMADFYFSEYSIAIATFRVLSLVAFRRGGWKKGENLVTR